MATRILAREEGPTKRQQAFEQSFIKGIDNQREETKRQKAMALAEGKKKDDFINNAVFTGAASGVTYSPEEIEAARQSDNPYAIMAKPVATRANKQRAYEQDLKERQLAATSQRAKDKSGKLSAKDVMTVQEGEEIPNMLGDISTVLRQNQDLFGPIKGRYNSLNPYDEKAQTVDAQMRAVSQAFGRFMEGGVLRKEDEEKYRKMFPQLSDEPGVARNKLAVVNRLMGQKQKGSLGALSKAGYDVSAFDQNREIPAMPGSDDLFNTNQIGNVIPGIESAHAAAPQMHPQAKQAMEWAQQNPNDPRAKAIMQRLGGGQ